MCKDVEAAVVSGPMLRLGEGYAGEIGIVADEWPGQVLTNTDCLR